MPGLSDIRIVAIEQYGAGPYGTLHLAELGAEIIKIEHPDAGDVGRDVPPFRVGEDSLFFQSLNRSKLSVCLDVSSERGRAVLEDLVHVSDGVYSNLRGDVPSKLRIRYDDLRHVNPRIVCCSLSGFGMTGPRASQPGFDYMLQGLTGWMSVTGEPSGPPLKTGMSAVDFATGLSAALSLMSGIHIARRDGVGADCDVSLMETALSMLNYLATWTGTRGYEPLRVERSGHPTIVPFSNFPTRDGWIVAGGSKAKFWVRLAAALGLSHLVDDPRFASFEQRLANKSALVPMLDEAFLARTTSEWLGILAEHEVPCAPINTIAQALADPQVIERDAVFTLDHPEFGPVTHVGSPVRVSSMPHVRANAPRYGEHTRQVLSETLGYPRDRIEHLSRVGVVAGEGLPGPF